jgi:AraC-like DNA-binding protein
MDKENSFMKLLRLKSNLSGSLRNIFPFAVYTVGTEIQPPLTRMKGFSAHQLFLTVSGTGKFRKLANDKDKWDILESGSLLYIPAGCMHEYTPTGQEPWQVAYVTFLENFGGMMDKWGLRGTPRLFHFAHTDSLVERIYAIWDTFGEEQDEWTASEQLLSLLLDLQKNDCKTKPAEQPQLVPGVFRETIMEAAVQFMHDHLNRPLTIERLAQHVGYSQKQLTRLFRQSYGTTPLQYLHRLRLNAAQMLLLEYPELTVKQVAAYVGMEPDYFTRLYKRTYDSLPSEDAKTART